jgi:hypothetical protein
MYHIVYKNNLSDFYSKGINIKADNPIKALEEFKELEPNATFLAMCIITEYIYLPNYKIHS